MIKHTLLTLTAFACVAFAQSSVSTIGPITLRVDGQSYSITNDGNVPLVGLHAIAMDGSGLTIGYKVRTHSTSAQRSGAPPAAGYVIDGALLRDRTILGPNTWGIDCYQAMSHAIASGLPFSPNGKSRGESGCSYEFAIHMAQMYADAHNGLQPPITWPRPLPAEVPDTTYPTIAGWSTVGGVGKYPTPQGATCRVTTLNPVPEGIGCYGIGACTGTGAQIFVGVEVVDACDIGTAFAAAYLQNAPPPGGPNPYYVAYGAANTLFPPPLNAYNISSWGISSCIAPPQSQPGDFSSCPPTGPCDDVTCNPETDPDCYCCPITDPDYPYCDGGGNGGGGLVKPRHSKP